MQRLFIVKPPKLLEYICKEEVCPYSKSWQSERERKAMCRTCKRMRFTRELEPFDPFKV